MMRSRDGRSRSTLGDKPEIASELICSPLIYRRYSLYDTTGHVNVLLKPTVVLLQIMLQGL